MNVNTNWKDLLSRRLVDSHTKISIGPNDTAIFYAGEICEFVSWSKKFEKELVEGFSRFLDRDLGHIRSAALS